MFRGFIGKKSGKDLCVLIEEVFTPDDLKEVFNALEGLLLSKATPKKKHVRLTGYIEVKADDVSSDLAQILRELEGQ